MKNKKAKTSLFRGLAATAATLLALSTVGYSIAKTPLAIGWVDGFFGIENRETWVDKEFTIEPEVSEDGEKITIANYEKNHKSWAEFVEAFKAHGERQGEEGFALMKNDNAALPLSAEGEVALFGWNAFHMPSSHTGVVAGNEDAITLETGLKNAGVKLNETIKKEHFEIWEERENSKGEMETVMTNKMASASLNYTVPEVFDVKDSWNIKKDKTTAIVALGRGGGEGANYMTDTATNAEDPLALSDEEIEMIAYAKEHCSKVVVLIVSANAMELGPISKGGQYEVDAIGFCGIPNDYQYGGIAKVLAGKANATGAMTDTYVYDNSFTPAVINMGQQQYADKELVTDLTNNPDLLGRTGSYTAYQSNNYIVQAEGIYVGYKYYETRYYDSIVNEAYKANATIGSTKVGEAWDYSNEVLYTFGHGLSYIPYSQEVTEVIVTRSENGNVVATVKVTNEGEQAGTFLAQLYVNRPYTEYDIENKIEKSAVDFLNSKKVYLNAGESKEIEITVPTKYLASWDSNGAGTYVLDEGDYYFTAAAGAHEAVNNVLSELGYETDGTTEGSGSARKWMLKEFDAETYSVSTKSGKEVKVENQADDGVDINYWLPGKVTYLSRSDWAGTFPKNYTNLTNDSGIAPEEAFKIADSAKKDEWINALRNIQYVPQTDGTVTNVVGIVPEPVASGKFPSVWAWITSLATEKPAAFLDINSEEWQAVGQALSVIEAVGAVIAGGGQTDSYRNIGNPSSTQSESVAGYSQTITIDDIKMKLAIASNTLLGSSFNPELAYEWGLMEGESGLWLQEAKKSGAYTVWGGGLNQHRHAYNGRNSEYMSEDPMLTNRIGYAQYAGAVYMGSINGPKHMGFNDQELNRQGNACYMTEQKMRETDIRCYEGALSDARATGVMMSFARLGAINCTNHVGLCKNIMREEWGFTGIITTDMGHAGFHEPRALIMATVNQYAGFGSNDYYFGSDKTLDYSEVPDDAFCSTRTGFNYITYGSLKKDPVLVEQARQTMLYQLYTIAHSSSGGVRVQKSVSGMDGPTTVTRPVLVDTIEVANWEYMFMGLIAVTAVCTVAASAGFLVSVAKSKKEEI